MANHIQRQIDRQLGSNVGQRLDYSRHAMRGRIPINREEMKSLILDANTKGPNSAEYADLMHLYQQGYDMDSFPDTSNAGVPRSIQETAAALNEAGETSRAYFKPETVHPLLHQTTWQGTSLAELGPEAARQILHASYVDADQSQRASIREVLSAIDSSPTSQLGISWEVPDAPLEFTARSGDMEQDPSGYVEWRQGQAGYAPGLQSLMLQAQHSDQMWDGLSNTGGGGGTYDHYTAQQMNAVRNGDMSSLYLDSSGMHQGDPVGDVISPQG